MWAVRRRPEKDLLKNWKFMTMTILFSRTHISGSPSNASVDDVPFVEPFALVSPAFDKSWPLEILWTILA